MGTCYYATDNFQKIDEFAPCRQEPARHGHHRFGYGMCGFSAAIPDDGDSRLFISAPGTWYWQGAVFSQNINNKTDRPNTREGPAHTDHHQMGKLVQTLFFSLSNIFIQVIRLLPVTLMVTDLMILWQAYHEAMN